MADHRKTGAEERRISDSISEHPVHADPFARWDDISLALASELRRVALAMRGNAAGSIQALFLDNTYGVLACEALAPSARTSAPCDPHVVLRRAAAIDAEMLILLANHRAGDVHGSQHDIALIGQISAFSPGIGVTLADYLIVAGEQCSSLMQRREEAVRSRTMRRSAALDLAKTIIRVEQHKQMLGGDLRATLAGSGWTLSCALYCAARPLTVAELSVLSALDRSSTARWLIAMRQLGLVSTSPAQTSAGGSVVELSQNGSDLFDGLISVASGSSPDQAMLLSG